MQIGENLRISMIFSTFVAGLRNRGGPYIRTELTLKIRSALTGLIFALVSPFCLQRNEKGTKTERKRNENGTKTERKGS